MVIQIRTNLDRFKNQDRTASSTNSVKNNQAANVNFKGGIFSMSDKAKKTFYTSKGFKKFAQMTANSTMLDAVVVLGLACVLRPLTIMAVPGAEKRDKQYASVHGMVSGVYGYITALAVYAPINEAVKNLNKKMDEKPDYLKGNYLKNNKKNKEAFNFIVSYGPKLIFQPILSLAIIALIPTVMKTIFPKKDKKAEPVTSAQKNSIQESALINKTKNVPQFKGKLPNEKSSNCIERMTKRMAKPLAPLIEKLANNKYIKKFTESMANSSEQKSAFLKNIITTGQALLGTLVYMKATMKNDKIEEDRKKTLAVNQFITWGISAIGTFTVSGALQKKFNKMAESYKKYNTKDLEEKFVQTTAKMDVKSQEYLKLLGTKNKSIKNLDFHQSNIARVAPSIIAFAFIYRYLTPVVATPLANVYKKHFMKNPEIKQPVKA